MLRQEREEIKYAPHKLVMLSTTQSTNMLVGLVGKCKKYFCMNYCLLQQGTELFTFVMSSCADKERTSYCNFEFTLSL